MSVPFSASRRCCLALSATAFCMSATCASRSRRRSAMSVMAPRSDCSSATAPGSAGAGVSSRPAPICPANAARRCTGTAIDRLPSSHAASRAANTAARPRARSRRSRWCTSATIVESGRSITTNRLSCVLARGAKPYSISSPPMFGPANVPPPGVARMAATALCVRVLKPDCRPDGSVASTVPSRISMMWACTSAGLSSGVSRNEPRSIDAITTPAAGLDGGVPSIGRAKTTVGRCVTRPSSTADTTSLPCPSSASRM